MRRINQALWRMAAAMYPVVVVRPTVVSITSTPQTEGTAITHTVTLSAAVGGTPATYPFTISSVTASTPSDYTATPTFASSGVTISGANLVVPLGVVSFPIIVATTQDTVYEGTETYSVNVDGVVNIGTINDDETAPTVVSVSSASAMEGGNVMHTVTFSGAAQMSRTFALSFTDITAIGGTDYSLTPTFGSSGITFSGGNITVPPGVLTSPVYVSALTDALTGESAETYQLNIGGAIGTGTITNVTGGPVTYGAQADAGQTNETDTLAGGANRYWFNSSTGLNTNPGTSALPFQYLDKLNDYATTGGSVTAPPSSQFVLARGTTYNGFLGANTISASAPFVFYGDFHFGASGTGARPKIFYKNTAALRSFATNGGAFNRPGTSAANIDIDLQLTMCASAGSISGTFVADEVITATGGKTGIFIYNDAGYFTIQCTSASLFANTNTITGQTSGATAVLSNIAYVGGFTLSSDNQTLQNLTVANALGNGVLFAVPNGGASSNGLVDNVTVIGCCKGQNNGANIDGGGYDATHLFDGLTVTNNTSIDGGSAGSTTHCMYLSWFRNGRIANNWSYMTGPNNGNMGLVIHGTIPGAVVEDNKWENCNNGHSFSWGYGGILEFMDDFVVRRNINRNHGYVGSVLNQGYAFLHSSMRRAQLYNNLHYGSRYGGVLQLGVGPAAVATDIVISHEMYYNNCLGTALVAQLAVPDAIPGVVVQNTIFMSTASSGILLEIAASCVALGAIVRNNIFYMPNNTGAAIKWNGNSYTIDQFLALAEMLGQGNIKADPLFVDAAGGDFRLQAGSPAKLAGYNSGISTDFAGNARNATTPSIGAYE